jgi:histone H3/H4
MAAGTKKSSGASEAVASATAKKAAAPRKTGSAAASKKKTDAGPRLRVLKEGEFMTKASIKRLRERAGVQRLSGTTTQFCIALAGEYLRLITTKAAVCTDISKRSMVNEADVTAAGKALGLWMHGNEIKKKKKKKATVAAAAEGEEAAPAAEEAPAAAAEEEAPAEQGEEEAPAEEEQQQQQEEEAPAEN